MVGEGGLVGRGDMFPRSHIGNDNQIHIVWYWRDADKSDRHYSYGIPCGCFARRIIQAIGTLASVTKESIFDEHFDGIVYAVCVGLGFAGIENVLYVFSQENWVSTAIVRSLLAVPGHYAFAILMGYYYSIYHFVDHSPKIAACVLLVPVFAHGVYDALAMSGLVNPVIGGISFLVLIYFCVKMHKVAKTKVLALIDKDKNMTMS